MIRTGGAGIFFTTNDVNRWVNYLDQRPSIQHQLLRDFFNLPGTFELRMESATGLESGHVRLNTLTLNDSTPGASTNPYPWTGTYFQGVPIELEALPEPGHRFVGWVVSATNGMAPMSEGRGTGFLFHGCRDHAGSGGGYDGGSGL